MRASSTPAPSSWSAATASDCSTRRSATPICHEPFATDTLSALYCTAKPILATAVLNLIAEDELSFDDRLGDLIDDLDLAWIADRSVEEVLAHTAGLHVINTILARILPERSRAGWLYSSQPPDGWRFGVDRAYSEFGGWYLLGRAVEALTEQPFDAYVPLDRARPLRRAGGRPDPAVRRRFVRTAARSHLGHVRPDHGPARPAARRGRSGDGV